MFRLSTIAALLFTLGVALVIWLFGRAIIRLRSQSRPPRWSKRRLRAIRVAALLLGLGLIGISQLLFWISSGLDGFNPITAEQSIALIEFHQPENGEPTMSIATRKSDSDKMIAVNIVMGTEAAAIEVEVLSFPAWLSFLDIEDCYRISSVQFSGEQTVAGNRSGEHKLQQDVEPVWRFFEHVSDILPTFKASKIVSDPVYFAAGTRLEVFTTKSQVVLSEL